MKNSWGPSRELGVWASGRCWGSAGGGWLRTVLWGEPVKKEGGKERGDWGQESEQDEAERAMKTKDPVPGSWVVMKWIKSWFNDFSRTAAHFFWRQNAKQLDAIRTLESVNSLSLSPPLPSHSRPRSRAPLFLLGWLPLGETKKQNRSGALTPTRLFLKELARPHSSPFSLCYPHASLCYKFKHQVERLGL